MSTNQASSVGNAGLLHSPRTRIHGREHVDPSLPSLAPARTASGALGDALLAIAERGETPPCFGLPGFTSDDPLERRMATRICDGCAIRELCQAAADERDERFGVWAGRDRTPRTYKHKESA